MGINAAPNCQNKEMKITLNKLEDSDIFEVYLNADGKLWCDGVRGKQYFAMMESNDRKSIDMQYIGPAYIHSDPLLAIYPTSTSIHRNCWKNSKISDK